jgi:hypothetical protein
MVTRRVAVNPVQIPDVNASSEERLFVCSTLILATLCYSTMHSLYVIIQRCGNAVIQK